MQVSLAPPLWKKTACLADLGPLHRYCHSRGWKPPRPMLCLMTSVGCLPLRSLHLAEDDQVLFLVHLLDLHDHDVAWTAAITCPGCAAAST